MTEQQMGVVLEVEQDDGSTWRDAVYLPRSEAIALSEEDIAALTQERYAAHQQAIADAQAEHDAERTPEAQEAAVAGTSRPELEALRAQAQQLIDSIDVALAAQPADPPQEPSEGT